MNPARVVAVLSATLAVGFLAVSAGASTLSIVGASAKVCQLTGQTDWFSGQTTNARTLSRYGLQGVDLGFPVESDTGALYLMFGDAVPNGHPPGSSPTIPPDDVLGQTTRTAAPDATACLNMTLLGSMGSLGHPTVTPAIPQGSFNVPTGGVYVGSRFYAFFLTDHCLYPNAFGPDAVTPLQRPSVSWHCPESDGNNSLGTSVLAYASDSNPLAFTQVAPPTLGGAYVAPMPSGFDYVTAAPPVPRMRGVYYRPGSSAPIPIFGVARYRMSIPYLAYAPQATFGAVSTWQFYGGTDSGGFPIWLTYAQWESGRVGSQWAPPAGAELYANSPNPLSPSGDERCVGEHSITRNGVLQAWLMLYTCGGLLVEARTAPTPAGPWSAPTVLLSAAATPGLFCTLFWGPPGTTCPGLTSQQTPAFTFGYLYAPFVLARYTQNVTPHGPHHPRRATIYWLLSTWDPYQVVVMQSTLELAP
jgi:hypothetical protein